jgi:acetyl esterase/lipase
MNDAPPGKPFIGAVALVCGLAALLAGVAIYVTHQSHRSGAAEPFSTAEFLASLGIEPPRLTWVGLQHDIDWIMASSAAAVLSCAGVILAGLGGARVLSWRRRKASFAQRWLQNQQAKAARERVGN